MDFHWGYKQIKKNYFWLFSTDKKLVHKIAGGLTRFDRIWECFFAFTVRRENTYISRLLAIIFIHMTDNIIVFSCFIIKKTKIIYFDHMQSYAKSNLSEGLSAQKKLPYESFFSLWKRAVENTDFWGIGFLLRYRFIHKSNAIYFFSGFIKMKYKMVCSVTYGLVSKVYCL